MAEISKPAPEIPEPTRDDLLGLAHAEFRDQLASGQLPSKVAEPLWDALRTEWFDRHKAEAARQAELGALRKLLPEPKPKPTMGQILGLKPEPEPSSNKPGAEANPKSFGSADGGAGTFEQSLPRPAIAPPPVKSPGAAGEAPRRWYRKLFPESWHLRPIPRGLLALAGVIAVWILDRIDAPLWLAITTLIVLLASAAAWSWIEQQGRQKWFWVSLVLYATFVVVVVYVHLSPPSATKPDWRRSDEARQLASQMARDVQKLEDEGRLIDLTDYHRALKVYADWVEKCSVTLGRIDNQMRKFRRETTYRYYFEKSVNDMRKLLDENERRPILSDVIHVDVLALQAVEKALEGDTSPDRDPNYPNLLNPLSD